MSSYIGSVRGGKPQQYLGYNPMGRVAVTLMLPLMLVLTVSGLVRAGTDAYFPPFGTLAADYVAAPGAAPQRMAELKRFKKPFGKARKYAAYTLMGIILAHIFFVVRAEVTEGGGLISAMFSGKKVTDKAPVDG